MHESGENYLETILLLKEQNEHVRSIDIAHKLGYTKPSISRAMGILKESGLIDIDQGGYISFTPKGKAEAERIYERHQLITEFLIRALGVDFETADQDACRFEHIISQKSFDAIKKYMEPR